MKNYIQMSFLGLDTSEARALENMFSLLPQLSEKYRFNGSGQIKNADIIIVNADDQRVLNTWNIISRLNQLATPLMMSSSGRVKDNAMTLTRPIQARQLIDQLENIARDNTSFTTPGDEAKTESELQVLVVDDSYAVRKFLEIKLPSLVEMPMHLSFASSGEMAMVMVAKTKFDIIFLDVVMGGVDGYKVCKSIKSKHSTYVVMLTGKKSPYNKVRGTMSGCNSYVTKPPSDEQLRDELEKCTRFQKAG